MGHELSKPSEKLRSIDREVNSLRSSIRSTTRHLSRQTQEEYVQNLAKYSNEANSLKGKVKQRELEDIQRNISNAVNEILTSVPLESELDLGAVETNSFIQVPVQKRHASSKNSAEIPAKKQKSNQMNSLKKTLPTLQDIDQKLKSLKPQISVALDSKDTTQLRVHQQTIKVLATDLEMIDVHEETQLGQKKKKLETSIAAQYQKVTKAMKEIRRNRDINYLTKQNKKEKALNELEDIRKNLDEAEIVMKKSLKNNESLAIKNIQDNLIVINQRLSSVETADDTTKAIKLQLTDKITWFYRHINDNSNTASQSDLLIAQSNYEDIVKNIASGKNKDTDDLKVKLDSLKTFIKEIKETDEDTLKRKQQLLYNLNISFSDIVQNGEDKKTTIYKSSVSHKRENTCFQQFDTLCGTWKSLEAEVRDYQYPQDDIHKIIKILEDLERSIGQTRRFLSKKVNSKSNLNTKLNFSDPNLSSVPIHTKFGSSLSLDQPDQSIIKTRAKVYNLSTPEIKNINDQPVLLRNKKFPNYFQYDNDSGFEKIEEIKTQVLYIKEKFHQSTQKHHLKNKLESYIKILEGYENDKNQITANNAALVLKDIQAFLLTISSSHDLAVDVVNRRSLQIEESFENIIGIQDAVDQMEKSVSVFSGTSKDEKYIKLKKEITDCENYLRNLRIPAKYDMIKQQKEDVLHRLGCLSANLEKKSGGYQEDAKVVHTRNTLNNLKEKVNRFSGSYKGVLYNNIEFDLNKLLVGINENIEDKKIAEDITKDVEKHLKILEHRSTKNQSFRQANKSVAKIQDETNLIKLKNDLIGIKNDIDTAPINAINLFVGLKSRLDLVKLGLDQLKIMPDNDEKQKELFYNEVETLKNVLDVKIALGRTSIKQISEEKLQNIEGEIADRITEDKMKKCEEEFGEVVRKFKKLKPEIEKFIGTTSDNKFYELDEMSIRLVLKMDNIQFPRGNELYTKKIELLKDIYNYGDILDQRAKETETIIELEREISDLQKNYDRYTRTNLDLKRLEEKANSIKVNLESAKLNKDLSKRKSVCSEKISDILHQVRTTIEKNEKSSVLPNIPETTKINVDNDLDDVETEFNSIKMDIETFKQIHADQKYYELDGRLTSLLNKLDNFAVEESTSLYGKKQLLLKEMHLYSQILNRRATENEIYMEIGKQLTSVNTKVDKYKGENKELTVIEKELKSIKLKLSTLQIRDDLQNDINKKYDILFDQYSRFKEEAQQKINSSSYIGSSSFIKDLQKIKSKSDTGAYKDETVQQQLINVQKEIDEMKGKVSTFVNSYTSEDYRELEEKLLQLHLKVKNLNIKEDSLLFNKTQTLKETIQECLEIMDDRAAETESIIDIENNLEQISKKFDYSINDVERNVLDESLISLQVKLGKLHVNDDLSERKNMCMNRILIYLKQLKQDKSNNNSDDEQSGTFV